jgi:hypothetical protein
MLCNPQAHLEHVTQYKFISIIYENKKYYFCDKDDINKLQELKPDLSLTYGFYHLRNLKMDPQLKIDTMNAANYVKLLPYIESKLKPKHYIVQDIRNIRSRKDVKTSKQYVTELLKILSICDNTHNIAKKN